MRQYEMMIILDPEVDERNLQPTRWTRCSPSSRKRADPSTTWTSWAGASSCLWKLTRRPSIYVVIYMTVKPDTAKELDRQLGLNEMVMRTKLLRYEVKTAAEAK